MNLWDKAVESLKEKDKQNVDFQRSDKRAILVDLLEEIQKKKQLCIEQRIKYKRKNGQPVVLYDVFEKIVNWVNKFKDIGDVAMQYDPGHAALPWAGIRFFLQISVNDVQIFGGLVEGLEVVCKTVARYAAIENLYLRQLSSVENLLEDSIVATYASILRFFSKCRRYFDLGLARRLARSTTQIPETLVNNHLDRIANNDRKVLELTRMVDAERSRSTEARQLSMTMEINNLNNDLQVLLIGSTDSASKLEALLGSFQDPLVRTAKKVEALSQSLIESRNESKSKEERLEILQWLSNVQYKKHHQSLSKGLLEGTGSWLLKKPQVVEWRNSSVSSVLWLHGIPGSGKTCLTSMFVQRLLTETLTCTNAAPVAYFYCTRNTAEPQRSDPTEVLRAILKQLMCSRPDWQMDSSTAKEYRTRKKEAEIDNSEIARLDIWETTCKITQAVAETPVTIFIDAIDECRFDQRYQLLQALDHLLESSDHLVKVFVSSREDVDIVLRLQKCPNIYINVDDNRDDINRFVQAEIGKALNEGRLLNGRVSSELQRRITKSLIMKAQGMFLWVSLQIKNLCDTRRIKVEDDLMDELARLPQSLAGMYSLIFDSISQIEKHGRTIAETMLRWLLCTKDATSKTTIAACSGKSSTGRENLSIKDFLNLCCNLVVYDVSVDTFRFAHLSVREYLESRPGYTLSENNMFLLERLFPTWIDNQSANQDLFCSYAARYWVFHYRRLNELHRRRVFGSHAKRFFFNGANNSEAFNKWITNWSFWNSILKIAPENSIISPVDLACCFGWLEILDHYETNQHLDVFRGSTIIMMNLAIRHDQMPVVRWLLARHVRPVEDQLELAFRHRRQEMIQIFYDLDVLTVNTLVEGQHPLFLALSHELVDVTLHLIGKGADVDCRDSRGFTPLFYALLKHHQTLVTECILQAGATVKYYPGGTSLLHAGSKRCLTPLIASMLQAGADPEAQENVAQEPPSLSICAGHEFYSRSLPLRRSFNSKIRWGEDLSQLALRLCCCYTACLLLPYGVDPLLEDEKIRAAWMAMLTWVVTLHGLQIGASATVVGGSKKVLPFLFTTTLPEDSVSQTLLSLAAQLDHDEAFRLLLDMGVDPTCPAVCDTKLNKSITAALIRAVMSRHESSGNAGKGNKMVDELRQGPLAWAALTGNLSLAKSILDRGFDPNLKNRKGQTALYFTVQCVEDRHSRKDIETDKEAVFRLLLRRGTLLTPQSGSMLLAHALQAGYRRLAKLLIKAGAERPSGTTSIDGVMEPLWAAFDQGEEGIRYALLARMGGGARSDSLTDQQPSSEDSWCFGNPVDVAARLMCRGAMRVLGDAVPTAPDDS